MNEDFEVQIARDNPMPIFSGGDLYCYFDSIKIGCLGSITWTESSELPFGGAVGSMVLCQYNDDPVNNIWHTYDWRTVPKFNVVLTGTTKIGYVSTCTLVGVKFTSKVCGFSANDLGNDVGLSFLADSVIPWHPLIVKPTEDGFTTVAPKLPEGAVVIEQGGATVLEPEELKTMLGDGIIKTAIEVPADGRTYQVPLGTIAVASGGAVAYGTEGALDCDGDRVDWVPGCCALKKPSFMTDADWGALPINIKKDYVYVKRRTGKSTLAKCLALWACDYKSVAVVVESCANTDYYRDLLGKDYYKVTLINAHNIENMRGKRFDLIILDLDGKQTPEEVVELKLSLAPDGRIIDVFQLV